MGLPNPIILPVISHKIKPIKKEIKDNIILEMYLCKLKYTIDKWSQYRSLGKYN
tara:strand:- start:763 stop:924 length:162 start_codon:yes stop_codon:yes gene_type:complete